MELTEENQDFQVYLNGDVEVSSETRLITMQDGSSHMFPVLNRNGLQFAHHRLLSSPTRSDEGSDLLPSRNRAPAMQDSGSRQVITSNSAMRRTCSEDPCTPRSAAAQARTSRRCAAKKAEEAAAARSMMSCSTTGRDEYFVSPQQQPEPYGLPSSQAVNCEIVWDCMSPASVTLNHAVSATSSSTPSGLPCRGLAEYSGRNVKRTISEHTPSRGQQQGAAAKSKRTDTTSRRHHSLHTATRSRMLFFNKCDRDLDNINEGSYRDDDDMDSDMDDMEGGLLELSPIECLLNLERQVDEQAAAAALATPNHDQDLFSEDSHADAADADLVAVAHHDNSFTHPDSEIAAASSTVTVSTALTKAAKTFPCATAAIVANPSAAVSSSITVAPVEGSVGAAGGTGSPAAATASLPRQEKMNQSFSWKKTDEGSRGRFDSFGDDDSLFNEAVIQSTQAIEEALFDKSKNKLVSPAAMGRALSKLKDSRKIVACGDITCSSPQLQATERRVSLRLSGRSKLITDNPYTANSSFSLSQQQQHLLQQQNKWKPPGISLKNEPMTHTFTFNKTSNQLNSKSTNSNQNDELEATTRNPAFELSSTRNSDTFDKNSNHITAKMTLSSAMTSDRHSTDSSSGFGGSPRSEECTSAAVAAQPVTPSGNNIVHISNNTFSSSNKMPRSRSAFSAGPPTNIRSVLVAGGRVGGTSLSVRRVNSDTWLDFGDEDSAFDEIASSIPDDEQQLESWSKGLLETKLRKNQGLHKDLAISSPRKGTAVDKVGGGSEMKPHHLQKAVSNSLTSSPKKRSEVARACASSSAATKQPNRVINDADLFEDDEFDLNDDLLDFISQVEEDYIVQSQQVASTTASGPPLTTASVTHPPPSTKPVQTASGAHAQFSRQTRAKISLAGDTAAMTPAASLLLRNNSKPQRPKAAAYPSSSMSNASSAPSVTDTASVPTAATSFTFKCLVPPPAAAAAGQVRTSVATSSSSIPGKVGNNTAHNVASSRPSSARGTVTRLAAATSSVTAASSVARVTATSSVPAAAPKHKYSAEEIAAKRAQAIERRRAALRQQQKTVKIS